MTDRRRLPANGRVAAAEWRGLVEAARFVEGEAAVVAAPIADLLARPGGARDRQVLHGAALRVLETVDGWAFVQAERDGYVGYVAADALGAPIEATHTVGVPATHAYPRPDIKAREVCALPLGAGLRVVSGAGAFYETAQGWFVPRVHLRPANRPFADPVTVAQMLFGAPYLWGGNAVWGIDCSGLVQVAHWAAGLDCPGDSDMQMAELGAPLDADAPPLRGDLWFWEGHVALFVDGETLVHANAHHMAVVYEPAAEAAARIEDQGGGAVLARRRVSPPPG